MVQEDYRMDKFPNAARADGQGLNISRTKLACADREGLSKSNSFNTLSTAEESIGSFGDSTPSSKHSENRQIKRSSIKMKAATAHASGKNMLEREGSGRARQGDGLDSNDSFGEISFDEDDWWQQQQSQNSPANHRRKSLNELHEHRSRSSESLTDGRSVPETRMRRKSFDDFQSLQELFHEAEMKSSGRSSSHRDSSSLDDSGPKKKKVVRKISVKVKASDLDLLKQDGKDPEQIQEALKLMKEDLKQKMSIERGRRHASSTDTTTDDRSQIRRSRSKGPKEIGEQSCRGRTRSVSRKKSGFDLSLQSGSRSSRSKSRSRNPERAGSSRKQLEDCSESSQRSKSSRHSSVAPTFDDDEREYSLRSESSWTGAGDDNFDQYIDDQVESDRRRGRSLSRQSKDSHEEIHRCNSCNRLHHEKSGCEHSQRSRSSRTVDSFSKQNEYDDDHHQRRSKSHLSDQARSKSLGRTNREDSSGHSRMSRPSRGRSIDRRPRPASQAGSADHREDENDEQKQAHRGNKSLSRNSMRSKSLGRYFDDTGHSDFEVCKNKNDFDEVDMDSRDRQSVFTRSPIILKSAKDTEEGGRRRRDERARREQPIEKETDTEKEKEEEIDKDQPSKIQRHRSMSLGRRVRRNNSSGKRDSTSIRHEITRSKSLVRRKSYIGLKGKTLTKDDIAEFMKKAHNSMNASSSGWNYDHEDEEQDNNEKLRQEKVQQTQELPNSAGQSIKQ